MCVRVEAILANYTVSAGHAAAWLEYVETRGVSSETLLDRSGIGADRLADPDGRIPFMAYVELVRGAIAASGDTGLVLRFGAEAGPGGLGILGLIMEASATMFDAFVQMQRFGRLVVEVECATDGPRFDLIPRDGRMYAVDQRLDPNAFPELTELSFARLVCGPRRFLPEAHILSVAVTHPEPPHRARYDEVFQCPVEFDSTWNALELHPDIMGWPVAQNPRYVFDVLTERAETLLEKMETDRSVRARLERRLLETLHQGEISADQMAREMGISRQTLFRRLKAEDTTYADVLDDLRHRLALQYLLGRKVSVNETAYLVGFSEPSAFSHAFKRWTGKSPRAYRQDAQSGSRPATGR